MSYTPDAFLLYLFDKNEKMLGTRQDILSFIVEEGEYNLTGSVPIDDAEIQFNTGMIIGFYDKDQKFALYEVKRITPLEPEHTVEFYAEHAAMCDLLDEVCTGKAVTNGSAGFAVAKVIENTRWVLEYDSSTGTASTSFYFKSVWECLTIIAEKWNCAFHFRWVFDGTSISKRYIQVSTRLGADKGKRFELWKDINHIGVTYDDANVCTAAYGRGKGEQVGTSSNGDPTYGRRITFADIEWSKANGDPADKPLGQEYIENVEATALYGRCGRPRFKVHIEENTTDPNELLVQTWQYLKENSQPLFEANLSVVDLEAVYGFEYEGVRVGDGVLVICDEAGIQLSAYVKNISRNYLEPELTDIQFGSIGRSVIDLQHRLMENTRKALELSSMGAEIAAKNESLMDGVIDTMKTLILSSGTNFYTDEDDGSFIWENDGKTRAVRITGNGILLAKGKTAGSWDWETAITGNGIVADSITSGTLQASLIRIFGSNMFYWDAANIHIYDPENAKREIRIGEYDGKHYGIAFTQDGGVTWSTAIDFNGLNFTTESAPTTYRQSTQPQGEITVGSLWYDTGNQNSVKRWNGAEWQSVDHGQVEKNKASLSTLSNEISTKVSKTELDKLGKTVQEQKTAIDQNAKDIALRATSDELISATQGVANAAASDATAKANQALANAKVYSDSQLEVSAKKIATQVTEQIEDIQIGGRNLLRYSGQWGTLPTSPWSTNGGGMVLDTSIKYQGHNTLRTVVGAGLKHDGWIEVNVGTVYTYSAIIRSNTTFTGKSYAPLYFWVSDDQSSHISNGWEAISHRQDVTEANTWTKLYTTFRAKHKYIRPFIWYDTDPRPNATINVAYVKLEEGSRATDWSPSPEDLEADVAALSGRVTSAETSLTETAREIAMRATKTEVSTAKTEAIKAAANDATTKANSALNSAKSDATAKANNALNNAKTYTDAQLKVSSEEIATNMKLQIDSIQIGGKNLLVLSRIVNGYLTTDGSGTIVSVGDYCNLTSDFMDVSGGKQVVITLYDRFTDTARVGRYLFFSASKVAMPATVTEYNPRTPGSIVVDIPSGAKYMRITATQCLARRYKVEIGNKATAWSLAPEDIRGHNLLRNSALTSANFDGWSGTMPTLANVGDQPCMHRAGALKKTFYFNQNALNHLHPYTAYTYSAWVYARNIVKGTTNPFIALYHEGNYVNSEGANTWFGYGNSVNIDSDIPTWHRISGTFITDERIKAATRYNFHVYARDFTGDIYFRHLKLEEGWEATDWSASPEDAEAEVAGLAARVVSAESSITQHANAIAGKAEQTSVNGLTTRVSSVEAGLNAANAAITLKVSTTDFQNGLNSLQIGGRNLLRLSGHWTALPVGYWYDNGGGRTLDTSVRYQGYSTFRTVVGDGICYGPWVELVIGQVYTYSAMVRSNMTFTGVYYAPLHFQTSDDQSSYASDVESLGCQQNITKANTWTKLYTTFRAKHKYIRLYLYYGSTVSATFNIAYMKLEEGTRATDWTPAPEDPARTVKTTTVTIDENGMDVSTGGTVNFHTNAFNVTPPDGADQLFSVSAPDRTMRAQRGYFDGGLYAPNMAARAKSSYVTVYVGGSGDYPTLQAAWDSLPDICGEVRINVRGNAPGEAMLKGKQISFLDIRSTSTTKWDVGNVWMWGIHATFINLTLSNHGTNGSDACRMYAGQCSFENVTFASPSRGLLLFNSAMAFLRDCKISGIDSVDKIQGYGVEVYASFLAARNCTGTATSGGLELYMGAVAALTGTFFGPTINAGAGTVIGNYTLDGSTVARPPVATSKTYTSKACISWMSTSGSRWREVSGSSGQKVESRNSTTSSGFDYRCGWWVLDTGTAIKTDLAGKTITKATLTITRIDIYGDTRTCDLAYHKVTDTKMAGYSGSIASYTPRGNQLFSIGTFNLAPSAPTVITLPSSVYPLLQNGTIKGFGLLNNSTHYKTIMCDSSCTLTVNYQ